MSQEDRDSFMEDQRQNIHVIRGESTIIACALRKNENRVAASTTAIKRQLMGHRADFLVRKLQTEYACGESRIRYTGEKDTKLLSERDLKLPKMMKDQLLQLFRLCGNDESLIRRLEFIYCRNFSQHLSHVTSVLFRVKGRNLTLSISKCKFGFLQFGLSASMLAVDCPAGYVCRVLPTPTYKVPMNMKSFPSLLKVIELTLES